MIRILLVCSAGMSTSILVNNMRKLADPDDEINACPIADLENRIEDCDVILVSPQARFQMAAISTIANALRKQAALADPKAYGQMDGESLLDQARALFTR